MANTAKLNTIKPERDSRPRMVSPQVRVLDPGGILTPTSAPFRGRNRFELTDPGELDVFQINKMRAYPQIAASLHAIKAPIIAREWSIECDDDDIAEFHRHWLEPLYRDMICKMLLAVDFGRISIETVWQSEEVTVVKKATNKNEEDRVVFDDIGLTVREFRDIDPSLLKSIYFDKKGPTHFEFEQFTGNVIVPAKKILHMAYQKEFGNLYGRSRIAYAHPWWWWAFITSQFMVRWAERRGWPPILARGPAQTIDGQDGVQLAQEMAESITEGSSVAVSSEHDHTTKMPKWDIKELKFDDRSTGMISILEYLNEQVLRSIMSKDAMLGRKRGSTGTNAEARVIADQFILEQEEIIVLLENTISNQIIKRSNDWTFGRKAPRARINIGRFDMETKELLREIYMEALRTGKALPMVKTIEQILGIPGKEVTEEERDANILNVLPTGAQDGAVPIEDPGQRETEGILPGVPDGDVPDNSTGGILP